jgi:hypothetical protein
MARLKNIIAESARRRLLEADKEAPEEDLSLDDDSLDLDGDVTDDSETPVDGTEDIDATEDTEETDDVDEEPTDDESTNTETQAVTSPDEVFSDLDKTIEQMVGITDIHHTTSSSILDFEDGGQIMYVQPMVSVKSETLNSIIDLIISDVKQTYSLQQDEITGKTLKATKYWKSIDTLISTMVRSQLTKSDNVDGLIDEIKHIFKVLEVK